MISTHTPLAGRDMSPRPLLPPSSISTHTPLAGRDPGSHPLAHVLMDFYSHAPRGARPQRRDVLSVPFYFYSHAPRGARPTIPPTPSMTSSFLLTRPSRGATICDRYRALSSTISTHTPLAGRDRSRRTYNIPVFSFLLTRPSRGATKACRTSSSRRLFLLTRPSRGATG